LSDFGIIDIILKFKSNKVIISFILTSFLSINEYAINNISFYLNKINIESKRREETLIIPGVAKSKLTIKKMV
jgi:hypothetical protein